MNDVRGMIAEDPLSLVRRARARLLKMHFEAKVGHIGGNLSALDAMLHLHAFEMGEDDVFVLSKGHAAGALYVTLWALGRIDEAELASFHADGTRLSGHPSPHWRERIAFATGSLGHGLGLAAGVALGKRLSGRPGRAFAFLSDGECEEGSTWEAVIFARHHRLTNLTILVDANGLQGFGSTADVASLEPLADKFRAFGLAVDEIDGHAPAALADALATPSQVPRAIILRTVKGHGVSFMEGSMEWHYLPLNEALYEQALAEISQR
jgi:transketolase